MKESIGTRVRLLRRQVGITQDELAKKIGVSRSLVAQWETNRGGEGKHLSKIAETFYVPVEILLHGGAARVLSETIDADEAELLRLYRGCELSVRVVLLKIAERAQTQKKKVLAKNCRVKKGDKVSSKVA